jgi:hypothetical protein
MNHAGQVMRGALAGASAVLLLASAAAAGMAALPAATFQDQDGEMLDLASLRGRVVVIVYGTRSAVDQHIAWGKRIDGELRARGVYGVEDPHERRPVRILALAQMGGIPEAFRGMLRSYIRLHVEKGYSLWLDWEDRMSALYGAHGNLPTVVVADRDGAVRLVVSGPPDGAAWQQVSELLLSLT